MPPLDTDTRDRVIRLEAEMDNVENTLKKVEVKVTEMHDLLHSIKGATWAMRVVFLALAGVTGFLSSFALRYFTHG